MSVAIDINPEFSIQESAVSLGYNLDSGEEDLNRVIKTDGLETAYMKSINIKGFDEYAHFNSPEELEDFVESYKKQDSRFSLDEYKKGLVSDAAEPTHVDTKSVGGSDTKEQYTVVFGSVTVTLSNDEVVDLCQPVYRVYPNKEGVYLDITDINQYVNDTWTELCKFAFFNKNAHYQATKKKSGKTDSLNVDKKAFGLGLAGVGLLALGALAIPSLKQAQVNDTASSAYNLTTTASKPVTPTGGDNQSIEEYAKLQVKQTESMLKELGVDVSNQTANLGCFSKGG